jgi:hypothetical protein
VNKAFLLNTVAIGNTTPWVNNESEFPEIDSIKFHPFFMSRKCGSTTLGSHQSPPIATIVSNFSMRFKAYPAGMLKFSLGAWMRASLIGRLSEPTGRNAMEH